MYRRRIFRICLAVLLAIALVLNSICYPADAQNYQIDSKTSVPSYVGEDGALYPDWSQITLADIPPIAEAGSFDIAQIADSTGLSTEELIAEIGYDPSRSWGANTPIKDIFMLGDFKDISNIDEWNMSAIAEATGADLGGLKLGDFGLLKDLSVEDLISAVPDLEKLGLEEVEPLFDLAKKGLGVSKAMSLKDSSLGDLANSNFDFASLKMDSIDLSQYDFSSIEGLENAQFGDFAGSDGAMASEVPYMEYVQMASYLLELVNFNFIGKIDVVYGEKEARRVNTVSGSYQEGFSVPCEEDSCAYIELTDAIDFGLKFAPLHGKQWIAGKSQAVEGGFGPLKYANIIPEPGKEPTGRNVFGEFFKVVLTNTIESEGKAEFGLYFRFCMYIFGYKTCTPYAYGPVPWFPFYETDLIPLGFGGTTSGGGSSSPGGNGASSSGSGSSSNEERGEEEEQTESKEDCTTYKGINMGALKSAIANIESRGSGDYVAVGKYVQVNEPNGKINRGRALGKYQYMSYREEVRAIFAKKEGGLELLKRIENNAISQEELQGQLSVYFSQQEQEQVREQDFKNLLNRAYNLGDRDSKLVYRLGGWHYAGTGGFNENYATRAEAEYKKELGESQQKCQENKKTKVCRGKLIKPASSGVRTSGFGLRVHPITKKRKNHNGVDLAASTGTSILAADGGEVIFVQTGCQVGVQGCGGGFGNYIKIRHCNGWITYYAHLNSVNVKKNQKVSQGQTIGGMGTTGSSTGTHLHFELHIGGDGNPVDPEKYLPPL